MMLRKKDSWDVPQDELQCLPKDDQFTRAINFLDILNLADRTGFAIIDEWNPVEQEG